jgi:hypothetical protein
MPRHPMKRRNDKRPPIRQPKPRLVQPVPRKMPVQYRGGR